MTSTNKARYIKPETICIGDLIKVTRKHKDVEISEVGRVADRQHAGRFTSYLTAEGHEIVEAIAGVPYTRKITLLDRPADRLPGMENI